MGAWVSVQGEFNLNCYEMFERFNLNHYNVKHQNDAKRKIENWIEKAFNQHLNSGLALDVGCEYQFVDLDPSDNFVVLYDDQDESQCVTAFYILAFRIRAWDRNGDHKQGQQFIESLIHTFKSNGCELRQGTFIREKCDYDYKETFYNYSNKVTKDMKELYDDSYKLKM